MDDQAVGDMDAGSGTPESDQLYYHEGISSNENGVQELQRSMKTLIKVDLDLAYSSEKLVNLHILLMYLLARENDLQAMALENGDISTDSIEKVLVFDLLSGILDAEVRELCAFMDALQAEIVDVRHKMSSWQHLRELLTKLEEKLHDSEESVKHSQVQILEVKMQLAKFQRSILAFKCENGKCDKALEFSENSRLLNINAKSNMQMAKQQRHLLRMLEKSLARELDLEKKLAESRQNEDDLKAKLHYTEQIAFRMEEAVEVVWGRFLEAENGAEVLMNISKELVGQLHLVKFNLSGSTQRESETKTKLQGCIEELKEKDVALKKLESSNAEHIAEAFTLREKLNLLEEILKESQIHLNEANACNEANQEQLSEMENAIESLKESIYIAESRADSAEAKATQLTDTNLELTEELNFHKGSASNTDKKVGVLENQSRELEIQLQHARASSEASQEQQNMLYSAIWDMETLIEDLKSKVSKAESKLDTAEEQCVLLSETNSELDNELSFLKARIEFLETSLDQANNEKLESAKEINVRTKFILDMVMQLAIERERIQSQLNTLTKENKILVEKLRNTKIMYNNVDGDSKEFLFSKNDQINAKLDKSIQAVTKANLQPSEFWDVRRNLIEELAGVLELLR
ncbi:WPP domain-interacting tail-anchored protein 2 isoform X3 [Alnus glutinosa]|uniref:WPP domain-interacting tail-anchored protein 2 isoform X2 n=1 Tax=Alnus glutinosa TaxID=3517 RepID=UPI002D79C741|nr:WPP domain-interacting tail-anchored protein 2 isoform X2 [Alnus glutinosa]XP_062163192.1 WPP domain-interacting tail-anchored protein 2 isoform X2 [Alnus glutinosa]XP_062163198.1 WPP domain-interacting tail-anchored protein 2 isoform X2 [Alnus glutinosa]XP_062163206.1 WPP domain-interacting tail-anchored protein 2 isoform X3 [Alnus glutinosa]